MFKKCSYLVAALDFRPSGPIVADSARSTGLRVRAFRQTWCDEGMPSPVGHALGGIIAGGMVSRSRDRWTLGAVAMAGTLADIDFLLPLPHRGPTHSLGAVLLVFVMCLLLLRRQE